MKIVDLRKFKRKISKIHEIPLKLLYFYLMFYILGIGKTLEGRRAFGFTSEMLNLLDRDTRGRYSCWATLIPFFLSRVLQYPLKPAALYTVSYEYSLPPTVWPSTARVSPSSIYCTLYIDIDICLARIQTAGEIVP